MDKKQRNKLLDDMEGGNGEACARLIEAGELDPNERDRDKFTYLHFAAIKGHADVCLALLAAKAKPNLKTGDKRQTPLHAAAINGNSEVAKILIKGRADLHSLDKSGYTPLHYAAMNLEAEVCRVLLEAGADINASPDKIDISKPYENPLGVLLDTPTARRDPKKVFDTLAVLLEHGANPNQPIIRVGAPLHKFADEGRADVCALFIANGADVNAQSYNGTTPLHNAAKTGQADLCACLLDAGANAKAKNPEGKTAMEIAKEKGFQDVALALESKKTRDDMQRSIARGKPTGKRNTAKRGSSGGL